MIFVVEVKIKLHIFSNLSKRYNTPESQYEMNGVLSCLVANRKRALIGEARKCLARVISGRSGGLNGHENQADSGRLKKFQHAGVLLFLTYIVNLFTSKR